MVVPSSRHLSKYLGLSLVILTSILAVCFLQTSQLDALKNQEKDYSLETLTQELEAKKLRLAFLKRTPTFGFDNLFADWIFLDFIEYFGDEEARNLTGHGLSLDYFEIIVDRDPRFRDMYLFLSTSVSLYAAKPNEAIALMEKGIQSLSPTIPLNSYLVWRYKATDELLFTENTQAAIKSFQKTAEWANVYSTQKSQKAVQRARQMAEILIRNPDSKLARVGAWTLVLNNANDHRTRKIAISQIEKLGGKIITTPEGKLQIKMPEQE